jgi:hypothetical protein
MEFKQYLLIGALSVSMLTGCGSDSDSANGSESYGATYTGSEEAGSISAETKDGFEAMGIEMARASVTSDMLYDLVPYNVIYSGAMAVEASSNSVVDQNTLNMIKALVDQVKAKDYSNLPVGMVLNEVVEATCTGTEGSLTVIQTEADTSSFSIAVGEYSGSETETEAYEITFNDYCGNGSEGPSSNGYVINGSVVYSENEETRTETIDVEGVEHIQTTEIYSYNDEYKDLTITAPLENAINGINSVVYNVSYDNVETNVDTYNTDTEETTYSDSETLSERVTMTAGVIVAAFSKSGECIEGDCTSTSEFTALDGKTYRVDSDELYGSYLEGLAFDANLGSVAINVYDLDICFDETGNVQLDSGSEITLLDSNNIQLFIEASECGVYSSVMSDFSIQP